jgi:hypothetical protein
MLPTTNRHRLKQEIVAANRAVRIITLISLRRGVSHSLRQFDKIIMIDEMPRLRASTAQQSALKSAKHHMSGA